MIESSGLGKRKAYILATVVYEYIATAEPVGSQSLTQKYNLGISSATVRNEMAELEAGGYLVQPHTSAGRIPSDAGYRTYVDRLMRPRSSRSRSVGGFATSLATPPASSTKSSRTPPACSGRLSNNLAFVTKPQQEVRLFKHIQLIWLSPHTGVAIVVTSLGVAAQSLFELGARGSPRRSHAVLERAQRGAVESASARRRRERDRAGRAGNRCLRRSTFRRRGRSTVGAFERAVHDRIAPARRTCSTSPSFKICGSCVRFFASSRSRRRSIRSSPTR